LSSCERFMRCVRASARFSAPLSRARSPVNARAWRGQGSDDVSRSRAKLVLCLGSQILNFHSRAFLKLFFFSPKYENKNNKIRGWDRAQHASQRHLSVLKTDSNLASMPRREYHSSCVCVPPGGPPEGILDIVEYTVSRVVFLLFLFLGQKLFLRIRTTFYGFKCLRQKWRYPSVPTFKGQNVTLFLQDVWCIL
jgi:hypothetical protein